MLYSKPFLRRLSAWDETPETHLMGSKSFVHFFHAVLGSTRARSNCGRKRVSWRVAGDAVVGAGARVVILSRHAPKIVTMQREPCGSAAGAFRHVPWDVAISRRMEGRIGRSRGAVNLVGRSVDCIKTPDHQDEILRSRVEATAVLGAAMRQLAHPPAVWVQMSTAHIYGDPPTVVCDEDSALGMGLAPAVGRAWEEAFAAAALESQRKVILRTSFVIGRDRGEGGGALARLKTLVRLGLGGTVGSGTQGMSWIHEADMNALFVRAISDPAMRGMYIASAPNPVSQREFMAELAEPWVCPSGYGCRVGW